MKQLESLFYERHTADVAYDLLGKVLVRTLDGIQIAGIITETEAYGCSDDPASHAYKSLTSRNQAMFGPVGHSYVYFIYGCHHCLNVVAKDTYSAAGGVLIRSIVPLYGISKIMEFRKVSKIEHLTNGPGKLAQAFGVTLSHNHIDMTRSQELYIAESATVNSSEIIATERIGISKGIDKLWRFAYKK